MAITHLPLFVFCLLLIYLHSEHHARPRRLGYLRFRPLLNTQPLLYSHVPTKTNIKRTDSLFCQSAQNPPKRSKDGSTHDPAINSFRVLTSAFC